MKRKHTSSHATWHTLALLWSIAAICLPVARAFVTGCTRFASELESCNEFKGIRLDLSGRRINYIYPGAFDQLNQVSQLDLSRNRLTYLPAGIFDGMTNLTSLDLQSNNFAEDCEMGYFAAETLGQHYCRTQNEAEASLSQVTFIVGLVLSIVCGFLTCYTRLYFAKGYGCVLVANLAGIACSAVAVSAAGHDAVTGHLLILIIECIACGVSLLFAVLYHFRLLDRDRDNIHARASETEPPTQSNDGNTSSDSLECFKWLLILSVCLSILFTILGLAEVEVPTALTIVSWVVTVLLALLYWSMSSAEKKKARKMRRKANKITNAAEELGDELAEEGLAATFSGQQSVEDELESESE